MRTMYENERENQEGKFHPYQEQRMNAFMYDGRDEFNYMKTPYYNSYMTQLMLGYMMAMAHDPMYNNMYTGMGMDLGMMGMKNNYIGANGMPAYMPTMASMDNNINLNGMNMNRMNMQMNGIIGMRAIEVSELTD